MSKNNFYFLTVKDNLYEFSFLSLFAIIGSFARIGLGKLTYYPNSYINPNHYSKGTPLWVNFTACLFMSLLSHSDFPWDIIYEPSELFDKIEEINQEIDNESLQLEHTNSNIDSNNNINNNNTYNVKNDDEKRHIQKNIRKLENSETRLRRSLSLRVKKDFVLYTGLTTGYCGSFSTFSSLIFELFVKTSNFLISSNPNSPNLPNNGYGVMEFFSVLITEFAVCHLGIKFGKDLERLALKPSTIYLNKRNFYIQFKYVEYFTYVTSTLGILALIANLILACTLHNDHWWKDWAISLCLSPFACYLRFDLARRFNSKLKHFPLGTFIANITACVLLSILALLYYGLKSKDSGEFLVQNELKRLVIHGFMNGFCGTLSTISTFMMELENLNQLNNLNHKYFYYGVSVITSFLSMVLIFGIYGWVIGTI
ncbi:hypothetical protein BVG19_g3402 [[Candida] boidinii]|nr:hypothetical protein BVG19_g3402 [[Candida] boidinii]OWB49127.1 hypothetical protein B5S27_g667 [[Candida] boidinii]